LVCVGVVQRVAAVCIRAQVVLVFLRLHSLHFENFKRHACLATDFIVEHMDFGSPLCWKNIDAEPCWPSVLASQWVPQYL